MESKENTPATENTHNTDAVLAKSTKSTIANKMLRYLNPKNNSRLGLNVKVLVLLLGFNLLALAIIFLCINQAPNAPAAALNTGVNNAKILVLIMLMLFAKIIIVLFVVNDFYNKGKKIK